MGKNICSFLLAIVMITSYVFTSIALPFPVHAESFQKIPNGTKLTVEELGFEITFPESWESKFEYTGEGDYIDILFKYENTLYTYDNQGVPPIFTIYVGPDDGHEEGLQRVRELATNGDKAYYFKWEPYAFYMEVMPVGPAVEELSKMVLQTEDVLSTFKVLDEEGAVAGEVEEKKQESNKAKKAKEGEHGLDNVIEVPDSKKGTIAEEAKNKTNMLDESLYKPEGTSILDNDEKPDDFEPEEPKQKLTELNYTFQEVEGKGFVAGKYSHNIYYIIKTPADNIRSEIINKPISESGFMGINGGFFDAPNYQSTPTQGKSISYNSDGGKHYDYNNTPHIPESRPTLVTYYDSNLQKIKVKIVRAKSVDEIKKKLKVHQQIRTVIGGVSYHPFVYDFFSLNQPLSRRTIMGYKEENGIDYVYLMITKTSTDIPMLTADLMEMGFNGINSMMLDGSGSTSMRILKPNGELFVDEGSELGVWIRANRHIFSMVRLINIYKE